jgi:glycosyltransferase involved in cell wall biosynthesis
MASAVCSVRGYLGHYATPNAEQQRLLAEAADLGVSFDGPVPKTEVASFYDTADVLLLILGSGRYVTSGKVFEYVATGLPIVSVHEPTNAASSVLAGYPLWFPAASLAPSDVATALEAAAAAALHADVETRRAAARFGERYRRDHQLDPRVTSLTQSVAIGGAAA